MTTDATFAGLKVTTKTVSTVLQIENAKGAARIFMQQQINLRDLQQFYQDKVSQKVNGRRSESAANVIDAVGHLVKSIGPMVGLLQGGGGFAALIGLRAI